MSLFRILALVAAFLSAGPALAVKAPVYTDSANQPMPAMGVINLDPSGNYVGPGGGGGASTVIGSQEQDVRATGTLNAATLNQAITLTLNGQSTVGFTFTGLTASGATVTYEQSNDGGSTWTGVNEVNAGTGIPTATRTTDGQTRVAVQGRTNLRVRVSTVGTGTITVASNISVREGLVTLASPLPPGTNAIGGVTQSGIWTFGLSGPIPAGSNVIGAVTQSGSPWTVSGTVTVGNPYATTTTGALQPPTAAAGKINPTVTALAANTSTTIAAANPSRIAVGIQCGSGAVSIDERGVALTAAGVGNGTLFIPSGTAPYFTPPITTLAPVTAYTATAQTCVVTEYLR